MIDDIETFRLDLLACVIVTKDDLCTLPNLVCIYLVRLSQLIVRNNRALYIYSIRCKKAGTYFVSDILGKHAE